MNPTFSFRFPLPFAAVAGVLLLSSCSDSPVPEPQVTIEALASLSYGEPAKQYDERADVKVEVAAARLDDQWAVVRGVFTPGEAGYHLYSKDLPMEGIEETGRPTYIEITEGAAQSGILLADQEPHDFTQYGVTLPVYHEGSVTLYRLVRPRAGATSVTAALTYMSCSTELCNMPIEGETVAVALP